MGTMGEPRAVDGRERPTRLCLLGVVRGERDDGTVELHGAQPRLVCAYLAVHRGRLVPADEIAQMLWPDVLSDHWEGAVRGVISKVRGFLHDCGPCPPTIDNVDHAYRLVLHETLVDIEDAEHDLADAVHHLAGQRWDAAARAASATSLMLRETLLPGLDNVWIERFRAELLSMRCRACRVAAVAHSRLGRHDEAIACAETAVAEDGFDEQNHRALMAAQLEAGNRGAALRAYSRCRRLLAEQLGVSPSDETEQLYLRALAVDTRAEGAAGGAPASDAQKRSLWPGAFDRHFCGRRGELDLLAGAWELAMTCGSQIVLVHGEAGVGKTALVLEAAREVQAINVVYGRCSSDQVVLFEPFVEAIARITEQTSNLELAETVHGFEIELAALVPSIAARLGIRPDVRTQRRSMLVEAVSTVISRVAATGPTVIVFDDLQWADASSLLLLRHMLRIVDRIRVLVCVTYRDDCPPSAAFAQAIDELSRRPSSRALPLVGLDVSEITELLRELAMPNPDDLGAVLHARTGGNCFYLDQVLRASEGNPWDLDPYRIPDTVNEVVRHCVVTLSEPARHVLALAAVIGFDVPRTLLDHAMLAEGIGVDAIDELLDRRLVLESEHGDYKFSHAIVRDAIYGRLTRARRRVLHRAVAGWVDEVSGDDLRTAATLARHLEHADDPRSAAQFVTVCVRADDAAMPVLAFEQSAASPRARSIRVRAAALST